MKQCLHSMVLLMAIGLLAGCADANLDELENTLVDIRRSPGEQPPSVAMEWPESRSLSYRYSEERSPFLLPETVAETVTNPREGPLAPDQQRVAEPLEAFQLQELRLVGTLRMGGRQVAMIISPDGNVTSVREGNYIGTDYGRISRISDQEIVVDEQVFTQRAGWQERQVSLAINAEPSAAR